jgi:hypothetical protein
MGHIDFLRAAGVWAVGLFVSGIINYVVDPSGLFITLEDNLLSIAAAIPMMVGLTYWYFSAPGLKPSARAGFKLGAFMFVASFALGALGALVMPGMPEAPEVPNEGLIFVACIAVGLLVPALTARWMSKR